MNTWINLKNCNNLYVSFLPPNIDAEQPVTEDIKEPKNPLSNFILNKYDIVESIAICAGTIKKKSEKGIGTAPHYAATAALTPIAA